ncbi:MAG: DinB family protein [Hymenobacteraceae bacterium]|nr:DinB family protein [Hymenobacteraceae bacterium]MDX5481016.1 DinB family protein [Hymenobacteraceae bacterium]
MIQELSRIFARDLDKLITELKLFKNEQHLWETTGSITNPAGNLALHLAGNLNTYIGHLLGQTGYVRNRPEEFSLKQVPRQELIRRLTETRVVVASTLQRLSPAALEQPYPEQVLGFPMTTGFFLIHLASHLAYHLGQVNYLRRALE